MNAGKRFCHDDNRWSTDSYLEPALCNQYLTSRTVADHLGQSEHVKQEQEDFESAQLRLELGI